MAILVTWVLLAIIGLSLGGGGLWLVLLGGSFFYLFAGLDVHRDRNIALHAQSRLRSGSMRSLVLAALVWAHMGSRFRLVAARPARRRDHPARALAADAWIRRPLGFRSPTGIAYAANPWPLAVPVIVAILVAGLFDDDRSARSFRRSADDAVAATPPFGGNVPDGEWHQYGRTPFGQRYSPLDQINARNVADLKEAWQYQTGDVKRPGRCRRDDLSGDAAQGRRHALSLHAAQSGRSRSMPRPARRNGNTTPIPA